MSLTVMMLATPPTLDEAGIDKRPDEPVGYLKTHWMSEDRVAGKPEAPPSLTEARTDKRPVEPVGYLKTCWGRAASRKAGFLKNPAFGRPAGNIRWGF